MDESKIGQMISSPEKDRVTLRSSGTYPASGHQAYQDSLEREIVIMPKQFPPEVRDRAVRMVLDRLSDYPSVFAACKALAPKLGVGAESLRR